MSEPVRLSVTEVRNALRCPRVFTLGRLRGNAVAFPVGSSCMGGAFHRIVDRLTLTVTMPPARLAALPETADATARREALTHWLLDFLVDELERDPSYRNMPSEVDDLAEALRQLASYLAQRIPSGRPAGAIRELLRDGEREVEAFIAESSVILRGRVDAIYQHPDHRLDVVEYKLTDEENASVDRAQTALYRELLRRAEQMTARPVILRFNPALRVSEMPEAQADALVRTELIPLLQRMRQWLERPETAPPTTRRDLCSACPVGGECASRHPAHLPVRDDPPMAAARPRPSANGALTPPATVLPNPKPGNDEDGRREAAEIKKHILEELRRDGIAAQSPEPIVGPTVYIFPVSRPRGSVTQLDRAALDVCHRLASSPGIEATYERDGARREFTVRRAHPRRVELSPLLHEKREWLSERPGRFVLGQQPDGTIVTGDLSDAATPHLLIGGQAGSGKSWLLRSIVASLVHWHGPASVRITLLDPKRVTFNDASFQSAIAAHLDGPLLFDSDEAVPCVERFVDVMEERYRLFETEKVSDLHEYNATVAGEMRLPRHVIVMDEFQDLTVDKRTVAAFCAGVARLGAKARAAGVHLVLATQRPDRETVPPILKANLGGKIALRVASAVNSRIILGDAGAENLLGKGDLLADLGQGVVRAQGAVVTA